ncbi:hypothetical protein AB0M54_07630 [Actinoplanes sp. NPDC051470]|uniref:hypothetical protein n=1 Tax=Actinoplanes sp. NPDC051470 TaxID=3157224 RepID=UPI00344A7280
MEPTSSPDHARQSRGLARFWPGSHGSAAPGQRTSDEDAQDDTVIENPPGSMPSHSGSTQAAAAAQLAGNAAKAQHGEPQMVALGTRRGDYEAGRQWNGNQGGFPPVDADRAQQNGETPRHGGAPIPNGTTGGQAPMPQPAPRPAFGTPTPPFAQPSTPFTPASPFAPAAPFTPQSPSSQATPQASQPPSGVPSPGAQPSPGLQPASGSQSPLAPQPPSGGQSPLVPQPLPGGQSPLLPQPLPGAQSPLAPQPLSGPQPSSGSPSMFSPQGPQGSSGAGQSSTGQSPSAGQQPAGQQSSAAHQLTPASPLAPESPGSPPNARPGIALPATNSSLSSPDNGRSGISEKSDMDDEDGPRVISLGGGPDSPRGAALGSITDTRGNDPREADLRGTDPRAATLGGVTDGRGAGDSRGAALGGSNDSRGGALNASDPRGATPNSASDPRGATPGGAADPRGATLGGVADPRAATNSRGVALGSSTDSRSGGDSRNGAGARDARNTSDPLGVAPDREGDSRGATLGGVADPGGPGDSRGATRSIAGDPHAGDSRGTTFGGGSAGEPRGVGDSRNATSGGTADARGTADPRNTTDPRSVADPSGKADPLGTPSAGAGTTSGNAAEPRGASTEAQQAGAAGLGDTTTPGGGRRRAAAEDEAWEDEVARQNGSANGSNGRPTGWATVPTSGIPSLARQPVPVPPTPRRSASLEDADDLPRAGRPADAPTSGGPLRPGDVTMGQISFWDEEAIAHFRKQWHQVKGDFVDDPVTALTRAHDLLTEAVNELTEALLAERDELDPLDGRTTPDTESMRMAMRGYREFLDRILAL